MRQCPSLQESQQVSEVCPHHLPLNAKSVLRFPLSEIGFASPIDLYCHLELAISVVSTFSSSFSYVWYSLLPAKSWPLPTASLSSLPALVSDHRTSGLYSTELPPVGPLATLSPCR